MEVLTLEEKERRKAIVKEAIANAKLEGFVPTQAHLDQWNLYINGEQSLDQTVQKLQQQALQG